MGWYYSFGSQLHGPLDDRAIRKMIRNGTLSESVLLWREGASRWAPASEVFPGSHGAHLNPFVRHWTGQELLWKAFWLNCLALSAALVALLYFMLNYFGDEEDGGGQLVFLGTWLVITVATTVWQFVGIVRNLIANWKKHHAPALLTASSVGTAIWLILMISSVMDWRTLYGIFDEVRSFENDQRFVVSSPRRGVIRISGDIGPGLSKQVANVISQQGSISRVELNSQGGLLSEAYKTAELTRAYEAVVIDECLSACTVIFLGSKARGLGGGSSLGFHSPRHIASNLGWLGEYVANDGNDYRTFLVSHGVDAKFAARAISTSPNDMWLPTTRELFAAGVVTRYLDESGSLQSVNVR